ncbi:MAG: hypothetical protein CNCCGFBP_00345 [Fimbriimonadaceae bacterium]|nr:hypothetical protein [Fimbriimonadaceae bacterium]
MKTDEELYLEAMDHVPPESLEFADLSFAIIDRVHGIMDRTPGMNQKVLAAKLGKRESEVSRWLAGMHNLTLRNLARLNVALGAKVVVVPPADAQPAFIYTSVANARTSDPYAVKAVAPVSYEVSQVQEPAAKNDPFSVKAPAPKVFMATGTEECAKAA